MKQLSWIQLVALCGIVVVAWGSIIARGMAEADPEQSADSPASTTADPFVVPDGDAATLLTYISDLQNLTIPQGDQAEYIQFVTKIVLSVSEATDKILTVETTDDQAEMAVLFKFKMLEIAKQLSIEPVLATKEKFLKAIQNDKRPAIVSLVKQSLFKEQLSQWAAMNEDAKQEFMQDLESYLRQSEMDDQQLAFTMQIGERLEESRDTAFIAQLYQMAAPIFAGSKQPKVVEYAKSLAGKARQLTLVGNELELHGTQLDGKPFDWSEYRGKVVLVDFWATWCPPCLAELPNVVKAYQQYHDKGFEVVGICLDDDKEATTAFIENRQLPWVTLFSEDAQHTRWQHPMAVYYGIQAIPTVILVGADGKVVTLSARGSELHKQLRALLGEPMPLESEKSEDEANHSDGATKDAAEQSKESS